MKLGGRELQGFGWMQTPAAADRVVFARARRPRLFARAPRVCGRGAFTRNVVAALGKTKTASMTPRESVTALKLAAPATIAPLTFVVSDEEKARVEEVLREAGVLLGLEAV